MKYINTFKNHAFYEEKLNGGGVDISLPNVSYCEDVKDIHYNPYNTVEFYVGNITGTTLQTVWIYTDRSAYIPIQVSEGNKWYTYLLPKDKGLYNIESGRYDNDEDKWYDGIVTKAVVKADITTSGTTIIPPSTVEASFKGSNTSKVTDMDDMFGCCEYLTSLDVSSFNTSNVTRMGRMFQVCSRLTSLDLSNFDTSNVTDMGYMFGYCTSLTSLDVSRFDTSKVTDMHSMFYNCSNLESLDLNGWNTSKVTNMYGMFDGCSGLTSLDLSGWNTSNVTSMSNMFQNCNSLRTIRMVGCEKPTIDKIKAQLKKDNITGVTIVTE